MVMWPGDKVSVIWPTDGFRNNATVTALVAQSPNGLRFFTVPSVYVPHGYSWGEGNKGILCNILLYSFHTY